MKTVLRSLLGCALFLLGTPALAGDTSFMMGTVVSAETKKPIEGVVVTATSPNLQGEQTVVTDAQGAWRIPQLPVGVYSLRFETEGDFRVYARSDLRLRPNRHLRVSVELVPGSPYEGLETEFVRRIAGWRPRGMLCGAGPSFENLEELEYFPSNSRAPAWALPHMIVLIPDGTPQTVYREPSLDRFVREWEE